MENKEIQQKQEQPKNKGGRPAKPKLDESTKTEINKIVNEVPPVDTEDRKVGRPTKMTEVTLGKLEMAFKVGCSDEEACFYADISAKTLYTYQENNDEFLQKKLLWKKRPVLKARQVVVAAIEANDLGTARWYLERKDPELGDKMTVEHKTNVEVEINDPEFEAIRKKHHDALITDLKESIKKRAKLEQDKKDAIEAQPIQTNAN